MPDMWFLQDGVTCHTARATMTKLRAAFGEQFISRSGPVNWPPRSCDLTPLDFFLWGYVFMDKPATIDSLEANIVPKLDLAHGPFTAEPRPTFA